MPYLPITDKEVADAQKRGIPAGVLLASKWQQDEPTGQEDQSAASRSASLAQATAALPAAGSGTGEPGSQAYARGIYKADYDANIKALYDKLVARPEFKYDAERDPLYQQYRDMYIRNGQQAMKDTVGAQAALTGGYGNSWGTTAGYQAYQNYLQGLNDKLPALEQAAYERYQLEGQDLMNRIGLNQDMADADLKAYQALLAAGLWNSGAGSGVGAGAAGSGSLSGIPGLTDSAGQVGNPNFDWAEYLEAREAIDNGEILTWAQRNRDWLPDDPHYGNQNLPAAWAAAQAAKAAQAAQDGTKPKASTGSQYTAADVDTMTMAAPYNKNLTQMAAAAVSGNTGKKPAFYANDPAKQKELEAYRK